MISAISNLDDKMNTLDLDAVKIFLMIVELRSFTKAAAAMDLAQSAVSTKPGNWKRNSATNWSSVPRVPCSYRQPVQCFSSLPAT